MPVSQTKICAIEERMRSLGIKKADLHESFVRSSGPGGQNVNKVSTCVVLKHIPSGIEVKCQEDRSQAMNRFLARRILVEKLETKLFKKKSEAEKKRWKIKKQKKRRNRRAKENVLQEKHHRSEKKALRKKISQL